MGDRGRRGGLVGGEERKERCIIVGKGSIEYGIHIEAWNSRRKGVV